MAVPKRKKSKSRRDMRRSQHIRLAAPSLSTCANCNAPKMPHRVCASCGYYKGQPVISVTV